MDVLLRRLRIIPVPWPMPYYRPLGNGVGEIRFDLRKEEHRLYGYFATEEFIVILASSGKRKQNQSIQNAKKLKEKYNLAAPKLEDYDV